MTRVKPYLQLVRLPNLFTAAADSLAGWLIVRGTLDEPGRWVPLVLASVTIYAGGIVLNDVFDYEVDLRERPKRPLPSGRVSRRFAAWAGGTALTLGPILAALSGSASSLIVALILAACVLAYDAGLKRTVLGPEVMGACRGLNLLLGLSQAEALGGPIGWLLAVGLALFVVGVTWISRSEVEEGLTQGLVAGLAIQLVGLLVLAVACSRAGWFSPTGSTWRILPSVGDGLVVLLAVAAIVGRAGLRALRTPIPATLQSAVKTGVLSLVWLDVAAVASTRGLGVAAIVAALWLPAYGLGRWLYST